MFDPWVGKIPCRRNPIPCRRIPWESCRPPQDPFVSPLLTTTSSLLTCILVFVKIICVYQSGHVCQLCYWPSTPHCRIVYLFCKVLRKVKSPQSYDWGFVAPFYFCPFCFTCFDTMLLGAFRFRIVIFPLTSLLFFSRLEIIPFY